jgi:heptaprenyl diphosphate synthase
LDILSDSKKEGKPVSNDLKEGIATLPIIMSVRNNALLKDQIGSYFDGKGDLEDIIEKVISSDGIKDAERLKKQYTQKCRTYIEKLPLTSVTGALNEIVDWL